MDLYFRLTGVCLEVPPLRNRLEDIALFAAPLLRRYGKDKKALGPEIQKRLKAYNWPGNVRELMAVLESYLVLLGDQATSLACFEEVFRHRDVLPLTPPPSPQPRCRMLATITILADRQRISAAGKSWKNLP